jgi:Uma2 family endonuclease
LKEEFDEKEEFDSPEMTIWQPSPLPTMYDLPSEDPEEPGLPDDFHYHQPQLLRETFRPSHYSSNNVYVATDLNLYYDAHNTHWYKRPDWFAVLGVPPVYGEEREMRYSYVVWQEKVVPFIVVELLSEGTEKEDLGQTLRDVKKPPNKWEVYEQILKIPYYVVFSRDSNEWQVFELRGERYHRLSLPEERFWLPKIQLGLGLWSGTYHEIEHRWLRWFDKNGWIPTSQESLETEAQRAEAQTQRAETEAQRANIAEQRAQVALEEGKKNKAIETARTMLADGLDAAVVMKYTGLSPDDLASL